VVIKITIIKVPVNKQNLLSFKNRLKLLRSSHDILEDKYEGIRKLINVILLHYQREHEILQESLEIAYKSLIKTFMQNKKLLVSLNASFCKSELKFKIKKYSRFGVPLLDIIFPENDQSFVGLDYGFLETSPILEETRLLFLQTLKNILIISITQNVLSRLTNELRKTRKKISSLKNIFIPNYEDTIKYIQFVLDEKEIYEIAVHKILKNKMEGK